MAVSEVRSLVRCRPRWAVVTLPLIARAGASLLAESPRDPSALWDSRHLSGEPVLDTPLPEGEGSGELVGGCQTPRTAGARGGTASCLTRASEACGLAASSAASPSPAATFVTRRASEEWCSSSNARCLSRFDPHPELPLSRSFASTGAGPERMRQRPERCSAPPLRPRPPLSVAAALVPSRRPTNRSLCADYSRPPCTSTPRTAASRSRQRGSSGAALASRAR
jgi:hypothetical protein